jgi:hypothetical protein
MSVLVSIRMVGGLNFLKTCEYKVARKTRIIMEENVTFVFFDA